MEWVGHGWFELSYRGNEDGFGSGDHDGGFGLKAGV